MKTKQLTFILSLTFLFLFGGFSTTNSLTSLISTQKVNPLTLIIDSRFYVGIRSSANDEFIWHESNFVPLIPENTCYGWEIQLDTERESVQLKEVFILPSEPKSWGDENDISLQHGNRVSVMEKETKVEARIISNSWCVTEGDPTGDYKIDVFVNGVLAKSFSFVVGLKI